MIVVHVAGGNKALFERTRNTDATRVSATSRPSYEYMYASKVVIVTVPGTVHTFCYSQRCASGHQTFQGAADTEVLLTSCVVCHLFISLIERSSVRNDIFTYLHGNMSVLEQRRCGGPQVTNAASDVCNRHK
jgi:hypothetical protein